LKSLYIHIPFCSKKCIYCDFLSFKPQDGAAVTRYIRSLLKELSLYEETALSTIYIGGGTPSILTPEQSTLLLERLPEIFNLHHLSEFTMEANPESINEQKIEVWKALKVNRISLGVQTFSDELLQLWGRGARKKDIISAVELVRKEGFQNLNIDLILGLQVQDTQEKSAALFREDLSSAVSIEPAHISVYMLTPGTESRLQERRKSGNRRAMDDSTMEKLYLYTVRFLYKSGYSQYEVSNFAKKGFRSAHNLNYWRRGDYIGAGLGAVTSIGSERVKNTEALQLYFKMTECGKKPAAEIEYLSDDIKLSERIMLALRMNNGIAIKELLEETTRENRGKLYGFIHMLCNIGYAEENSERLILTPRGILRSNYIIAELLTLLG